MANIQIIIMLLGAVVTYLLWVIKKYQAKVDELDNRVTRIETIISLLGDIKQEISGIKCDIAVIKNKISRD